MDYDVLIRDATIVDGASKRHRGSIAVQGPRIAEVGPVKGKARINIEARGLIAMPGFVDPHSHADTNLPWYPNCESAVMQGCTTVVAGQCGGSPAPIKEYVRPPWVIHDEVYERHPYLYHSPNLMRLEEVNEILVEKYGWGIDYRAMAEFISHVAAKGIGVNYAPLLGHGTVRFAVLGEDYKRGATDSEVGEMKALIRQGMEEGCIGLSAGLDYDPDVFAGTGEMDECVRVLRDYDGVYVPHWRRTGRRRDVKMGGYTAEPLAGINEVLDTARRTGVRLNVAHLAPGWFINQPITPGIGSAIGKATLEPIDGALDEGVDINFDVIPWECWEPFPYLCSLHFTQWLRLLGSRGRLAEWLKSEEFRAKAWEELEQGKLFQRLVVNPCVNPHWAENLRIVEHRDKSVEGRSLAEAARQRGRDPWNALCDLVAEDPESRAAHTDYRGMENQMTEFFRHPRGVVGLDVSVMDDRDVEQRTPPYATPLPDTFTGYPKFFIRYVRDRQIFTLEEAVQKCATIPARTFRLADRGVLRPGAYADIVLMDLDRLAIAGHPELSATYPEGVPYVLVNGELVVDKGKHTGARPGLVLTR